VRGGGGGIIPLPGAPGRDSDGLLREGGEAVRAELRAAQAHSPREIIEYQEGEPDEDATALRFTQAFAGQLLFDHDDGAWYEWDGTRFKRDCRNRAFHYARRLGRTQVKGKRSLCKVSVAAGAERFARADPRHAVDSSVWDANQMALGTPVGTVELQSGELRAADPADRITKQTSVAPEEGEPTMWLRFLHEALNGDAGAIRFLQQWFGYCLTGDTREHALAFIYGAGGNGKSVFLNTVATILGDYAVTAAMEAFTASKSSQHSTELAMLRGARLVTASETEEGRAWAESRIKQMTGGDPITARFMRQDFFTYRPQFKLTIAGNHAPSLANVDDAMRRRFNIVPFETKPARPDRLLEEKLRAEHGRILAWGISGCLDWQRSGLIRAETILAATSGYFEDQDVFGQWINDRCETGSGRWELPARLFGDWSKFAHAAGDLPGSQRSLSDRLKKRGFVQAKTNGLRVYRGLNLRAAEASAE
jgi:P4 family phage/plasmid primase-like protien